MSFLIVKCLINVNFFDKIWQMSKTNFLVFFTLAITCLTSCYAITVVDSAFYPPCDDYFCIVCHVVSCFLCILYFSLFNYSHSAHCTGTNLYYATVYLAIQLSTLQKCHNEVKLSGIESRSYRFLQFSTS